MNTLTIDTEFSSFNVDKGDLLQLSLIADVDGELHYFNEYARGYNRSVWSFESEKVHKISWVKSQEFQTIEELAKKFKSFLDKFDTVFSMICWNGGSDKKYLDKLIRSHALQKNYYYKIRPEWIDVFKMIKSRKTQIKLKNYQLKTCADYFKLDMKAHDASEDARITREIYELLKGVQKDDCNFMQTSANANLTEVEKLHKYMDMKYVQVSDGEVFLTKEATSDKEAMRVIFSELWSLFCE